ncbi:MAG: hypothetical protein PHI97_29515 [Desulfobulbus sp.]|nr:hypothetical protein [Desulfobulbus sp.]
MIGTKEQMTRLLEAVSPFIQHAVLNKKSMVTIELNTAQLLGLEDIEAGNLVVVIAAGPSKELLKQAVFLVDRPCS